MTTTRRIYAMAAAAALVLLVIWYFALYGPQSRQLRHAHAAHAAAEQQIGQLGNQVTQLEGLVKQIPQDTAKLGVLEAALPDNPELDQALDLLHLAAVHSGVTLTSVGPSTLAGAAGGSSGSSQQQASGEPAISLTLSATGSHQQVMTFLSLLASMPRVVVVDHLSLSGSGNSTTAAIGARIFYAGQPTP